MLFKNYLLLFNLLQQYGNTKRVEYFHSVGSEDDGTPDWLPDESIHEKMGLFDQSLRKLYKSLGNNIQMTLEYSYNYKACSSAVANPELFFYRSDHLGSTSLVNDKFGNVVQVLEYMPFGEILLEQRNYYFNAIQKFSAKELDEETGLYYFSARYYDPRSSIFMSVDPMADKSPNTSPYMYCFGNPIRLVDPDGKYPWEAKCVNDARRYAKQTGGEFQKHKDSYGYTYATVSHTAQDLSLLIDGKPAKGVSITAFNPTYDSWKNKIGSLIRRIDDGGHADGGLTGNITKQDVKVGGGIISGIVGAATLGTSLGVEACITGGYSILSGLSGVTANSNGESGLQQLFSSPDTKQAIGIGEDILSIGFGIKGIQSLIKGPVKNAENVIGTGNAIIPFVLPTKPQNNDVKPPYKNPSNE